MEHCFLQVTKLFNKYVPRSCPAYLQEDAVQSMTLSDLGGLFILLAIGTAATGLAKGFRIYVRAKKASINLNNVSSITG